MILIIIHTYPNKNIPIDDQMTQIKKMDLQPLLENYYKFIIMIEKCKEILYSLLIIPLMKKFFLIIILSLFTTTLSANDRDAELDKLFLELKKNIPSLSSEIVQQIWMLWSTHPTDQKLTSILDEGSRLVQDQQLKRAINVFTEAIELDPNWAEAWNKRATVFYMVGEFQKSQDDIDKVLELEERHFGALAGQGMVNIQLKNYDKAKRSYQKAQEIYPAMKSSKVMIEQIEELIKRQSI